MYKYTLGEKNPLHIALCFTQSILSLVYLLYATTFNNHTQIVDDAFAFDIKKCIICEGFKWTPEARIITYLPDNGNREQLTFYEVLQVARMLVLIMHTRKSQAVRETRLTVHFKERFKKRHAGSSMFIISTQNSSACLVVSSTCLSAGSKLVIPSCM